MSKYLEIIQNYPPYEMALNKKGFISKYFGGGHSGLDSVGDLWTMPICTFFDGKVTNVYKSVKYGNCVEYVSNNGRVIVKYYHLASYCVHIGEIVPKNTIIGYEGETGVTTGKHLHTSILIDGKLTDPIHYMKNLGALPLQTNPIDNKPNNIESEYKLMIRRVVLDLNLRTGAGINNSVIRVLNKGAILVVGKTVTISNGDVWGQVNTVVGGVSYAGWCNIYKKWSEEV